MSHVLPPVRTEGDASTVGPVAMAAFLSRKSGTSPASPVHEASRRAPVSLAASLDPDAGADWDVSEVLGVAHAPTQAATEAPGGLTLGSLWEAEDRRGQMSRDKVSRANIAASMVKHMTERHG